MHQLGCKAKVNEQCLTDALERLFGRLVERNDVGEVPLDERRCALLDLRKDGYNPRDWGVLCAAVRFSSAFVFPCSTQV